MLIEIEIDFNFLGVSAVTLIVSMVTCLQQYEDAAYHNTDNGLVEVPRDIPEGATSVHLEFNVISGPERGDRFPESCTYINLAYNMRLGYFRRL